eukprot:815361-Pyramimonas_sp.AAC.1
MPYAQLDSFPDRATRAAAYPFRAPVQKRFVLRTSPRASWIFSFRTRRSILRPAVQSTPRLRP